MGEFQTRSLGDEDREWVVKVLKEHWASTRIVSRGRVHQADELAGIVAVREEERIGLATYRIDGKQCELVTLNSFAEGTGVGSALVSCVREAAAEEGCTRLWLITTNDNVRALGFYQKRGFLLVAVHTNALDESRKLNPEIPKLGIDGTPLRDEIELEMML